MPARTLLIMAACVLVLLPMTRLKCMKLPEGGLQAEATTNAMPTTPDEQIKQAVEAKFAADPELKSEKEIKISVKEGHVTLEGAVSRSDLRMRAEDVARDASPDVYGVDAESLTIKEGGN